MDYPFSNLSEKSLKVLQDTKLIEELKSFSQVMHMPPDAVVLQDRDFIRFLPFLLEGTIKVIGNDENGNEILLYYLHPGETCIMSVLGSLNNERSKVKAVVEEEAEILFIPVEKSKYLVSQYPAWSEFIFRLYHKRSEELLGVVNNIAFKRIDERLLEFLKNKSNLTGSNEIKITHQQIADELGTAREVVSRLLKQMEKESFLRLGRNKITLL